MKITILVEGHTEIAFKPHLVKFLREQLWGRMPKLEFSPCNGHIFTGDKLKRFVEKSLSGKEPSDHVIALTDVYTGSNPPLFLDATDEKRKMTEWVGQQNRFHAHVAQYEFEAWLLPYWKTIRKLAGSTQHCPGGLPETVNHGNPPSKRLRAVFESGKSPRSYLKTRDASRILRDNDLSTAITVCPELRAFINTIITIAGGIPV